MMADSLGVGTISIVKRKQKAVCMHSRELVETFLLLKRIYVLMVKLCFLY